MEGSTHPDTAVMGLTSSARLPAQTLPARPLTLWRSMPLERHETPDPMRPDAVNPGSMTSGRAETQAFSNTATWLSLSEVKGARSQSAQRSRSRKPAIVAMRSSSDGQTYR